MSTVFEGKNVSATIFRLGVPAMLSQLATLIHDNRFAGVQLFAFDVSKQEGREYKNQFQ